MDSKLKEVRVSEGISQADLARRTGLVDSTIRRAERGRVTTPTTLNRILKGLNDLSDGKYELRDLFPGFQ